jgi:hypothetical protein
MLDYTHDNKSQIQHHERQINALQHRLYLMRGFVRQLFLVFQTYFWLSVESEKL